MLQALPSLWVRNNPTDLICNMHNLCDQRRKTKLTKRGVQR